MEMSQEINLKVETKRKRGDNVLPNQMKALMVLSLLCLLYTTTSQNTLSYYQIKSEDNTMIAPLPQLLGILLIQKADQYVIHDWLYRHVGIFDKLVAIIIHDDDDDTSYRSIIDTELNKYENVARIVLPKEELEIEKSIRSVLGNPAGRWIMTCRANEFWTIDPRQLAHNFVIKEVNSIGTRVLVASPLEHLYKKLVQKIAKNENYLKEEFHIMEVSNWVHNQNATSPPPPPTTTTSSSSDYYETRLFHWKKGRRKGRMKLADLVNNLFLIPPQKEELDSQIYKRMVVENAFHVKFHFHDFSTKQAIKDGYEILDPSINKLSGTRNISRSDAPEGWQGTFLDQSFPDQVKRFPPRQIKYAIEEYCRKFTDDSWPCVLDWKIESSFKG